MICNTHLLSAQFPCNERETKSCKYVTLKAMGTAKIANEKMTFAQAKIGMFGKWGW